MHEWNLHTRVGSIRLDWIASPMISMLWVLSVSSYIGRFMDGNPRSPKWWMRGIIYSQRRLIGWGYKWQSPFHIIHAPSCQIHVSSTTVEDIPSLTVKGQSVPLERSPGSVDNTVYHITNDILPDRLSQANACMQHLPSMLYTSLPK